MQHRVFQYLTLIILLRVPTQKTMPTVITSERLPTSVDIIIVIVVELFRTKASLP